MSDKARILLERIIVEHPHATRERWFALFRAAIKADDELMETIAKEVFDDVRVRSKMSN